MTKSGANADPVAVGNRAADAWAAADPAAVFVAAVSDDGFAALTAAIEALERRDTPNSQWTWPGVCDRHANLDPAGSFRRCPYSKSALALYNAAGMVHKWRESRSSRPDDLGWFFDSTGYGQRFDSDRCDERADALCVRVLGTTQAGGGRSALALLHAKLPKAVARATVQVVGNGMTRRADLVSTAQRVQWTDSYDLDAAIVDSEPMMAGVPDMAELFPEPRRRKRRIFKPGEGLPLKVEGVQTPRRDLRLVALERLPPMLAGDVMTLATVAHVLNQPMRIDERDGAALLARTRDGGFRGPKQTDIKRFWQAAADLRATLIYDPHGSGRWAELAKVEGRPNKRGVVLGRPEWMQYLRGGERWTLTAEGGKAGRARWLAGESGAAGRLITGIEYRLAARWDGKPGIAPDLRPDKKGGPGRLVFIPWRDAMALMGDVWDWTNPKADHAARNRWQRMVASLLKAGYKIASFRGEAEAGDSVEIVEVRRGSRARPAGLRVRASARFVEAARLAGLRDGRGFETVRLTDWLPEGVKLKPDRK